MEVVEVHQGPGNPIYFSTEHGVDLTALNVMQHTLILRSVSVLAAFAFLPIDVRDNPVLISGSVLEIHIFGEVVYLGVQRPPL